MLDGVTGRVGLPLTGEVAWRLTSPRSHFSFVSVTTDLVWRVKPGRGGSSCFGRSGNSPSVDLQGDCANEFGLRFGASCAVDVWAFVGGLHAVR